MKKKTKPNPADDTSRNSLPKEKRVKFVSLFFLYADTNFVPQAMDEAFREVAE